MNRFTGIVLAVASLSSAVVIAGEAIVEQQPQTDEAQNKKMTLVFNTDAYRPQVVMHDVPRTTSAAFVTISGVIFSRTPIDRVSIGSRTATLRQAEPKDLVKIEKAPEGATDAPHRTYFEVPDAGLPRLGANDLEVRAYGTDGRNSDLHRITVVRSAK